MNFDIKNAEFDELSQKYFDFAKKIVLDEKSKMDMMDSTYVELGYEKIKGRFVLFGKRLDDFLIFLLVPKFILRQKTDAAVKR